MFVSRMTVLSLIEPHLPQVLGTVWYIFSAYARVSEQPATHACRRSCHSLTKTAVERVIKNLQNTFAAKTLIPDVTLISPTKKNKFYA